MIVRVLIVAGLLALAVSGCVQTAAGRSEGPVVVVVDASAADDPAVLEEARAAVERAGEDAQLRVPRTPTEQLSVTHYFAARGYELVVGVNLDRRVAVTPVAHRYPGMRFVEAAPGRIAGTLAAAR